MRYRRKSGMISLDKLRSLSRTISGSTGGTKTGSMSSSGFYSSGNFANLDLIADKRVEEEKQKLATMDCHVSSSSGGISMEAVALALSLSTQGTPKDLTDQPDRKKISEDKQREHPHSKSFLTSIVQGARESDDPHSPYHATQSIPTKYSNAGSSINGPPISMPEELKSHGTTILGYVLHNLHSMLVGGDGRAVGHNNEIFNDQDHDKKLVIDGDYIFGAAGDANTAAHVLRCLRTFLRIQRTDRKRNGRVTTRECAEYVKLYFDTICPQNKDINTGFRKVTDVSILCASIDKGPYETLVPSMWVGTKAGAWKVDRFEALGSGGMYADLEVHRKGETVEEVVEMLEKGMWRAALNDFYTGGTIKICILKPKKQDATPKVQVGKKKKRVDMGCALGEVESHSITLEKLMERYGVFDDKSLTNQSESFATDVRGKGNTPTVENLESSKAGLDEKVNE